MLLGTVGMVLVSLFSWHGQNIGCWSLAFIIVWGVLNSMVLNCFTQWSQFNLIRTFLPVCSHQTEPAVVAISLHIHHQSCPCCWRQTCSKPCKDINALILWPGRLRTDQKDVEHRSGLSHNFSPFKLLGKSVTCQQKERGFVPFVHFTVDCSSTMGL